MKPVKLTVFLLMIYATVFSACAGVQAEPPGGSAEVINVVTIGAYYPFSYIDDDGKLTGYDVEVVRLLDERMEDTEIEFTTAPFDSMFLELDSGRAEMIACQIAKNPEREEKYLFTEEGYLYVQTKLVVNADDNTRTSLTDMTGEIIGCVTGDFFTDMLENYNEANGNPFELRYYDGEYVGLFTDISTGRIAGTVNDTVVVDGYAETLGLKIKCVGDIMESSYSYFCFRNDENGRAFKAKADAALGEIIEDGSLAALSKEWFGEDFTKQ